MAGFPRLVPGLDFKSSVERVATFQAGSIPVPRRHTCSLQGSEPLWYSEVQVIWNRAHQAPLTEPLQQTKPAGSRSPQVDTLAYGSRVHTLSL